MPLILLTNDDGVHSPGLLAAARSLEPLGDLLIVAPATQQSGASRSLRSGFDGRIFPTLLEEDGHHFPAWQLDGTPAQAVLYGVVEVAARLAGRRPDLIVSGINYGENLGSQTLISGTVGAAIQGGDMGIRSLAVSLQTSKDYHLSHGQFMDVLSPTNSYDEWVEMGACTKTDVEVLFMIADDDGDVAADDPRVMRAQTTVDPMAVGKRLYLRATGPASVELSYAPMGDEPHKNAPRWSVDMLAAIISKV